MVRECIFGAVLLFGGIVCGDSGCRNTVLQDLPSPDGQQHAILFERDCGATTNFSMQISVLAKGAAISGAGNVFITDADHGKAPEGPSVSMRWVSEQTLEIRHDPRARVFLKDARHDHTKVVYVRE